MRGFLVLTALAAAAPALCANDIPEVSKPPMAKKLTHAETIHGEKLADEYFWLRDRKNPEVT